MNYILSLDQGTSSSRAIIFDSKGKKVASAQKEFTQYFPKPGWVEHDPEEIWESQFSVMHKAMSKANVSWNSITGIGITNQRETTIVWDKSTGKAIYNAIVWQDKRTRDYCEELKLRNLESYVKNTTGLVIDSYFSGTKIHWILDNVEGALEKANNGELLFGTVDSWLLYKLTKGQSHCTDYTNASRTLLYDINNLNWDKTLLEHMNIPASMLPKVQASRSYFGHYNIGNDSIPILAMAGDQQAALFGQCCFEKGMAKNTYGTGCFMLMNVGNKKVTSHMGLLTTLIANPDGSVGYALEGSVFIAGAAIQWLRDGLELISNVLETEEMAENSNNEEIVVVPAFAGLGAPYWDMTARGAIFGLTRDSNKNDLAKATLQSLALQTKDVLEAMKKDSGIQLETLKVDGGAVNNNYLMQFQADILNVTVERPVNTESTAQGVAYLAGLESGMWSIHDIKEMNTIDSLFPSKMDANTRNNKYKQWKKAIKRTMGWLDE